MTEVKDPMGARLKGYEQAARTYLDVNLPVVIRLDGVGFSRYTKMLECTKPFDLRFMRVMQETSQALLTKFNFSIVYTQSDEITCIFPRKTEEQTELLYSGRIEKLASIVAAYATAIFNACLGVEFGVRPVGIFDARVFNVPSEAEALNSIIWRQQDCYKNACNGFAQALCSHKELQGLTSYEQVMYAQEKNEGEFFDTYPPAFRFGTIFKRVLKEVYSANPKTGEKVTALRTSVETLNMMLSFNEANVELVMGKYYEPEKYWLT